MVAAVILGVEGLQWSCEGGRPPLGDAGVFIISLAQLLVAKHCFDLGLPEFRSCKAEH